MPGMDSFSISLLTIVAEGCKLWGFSWSILFVHILLLVFSTLSETSSISVLTPNNSILSKHPCLYYSVTIKGLVTPHPKSQRPGVYVRHDPWQMRLSLSDLQMLAGFQTLKCIGDMGFLTIALMSTMRCKWPPGQFNETSYKETLLETHAYRWNYFLQVDPLRSGLPAETDKPIASISHK